MRASFVLRREVRGTEEPTKRQEDQVMLTASRESRESIRLKDTTSHRERKRQAVAKMARQGIGTDSVSSSHGPPDATPKALTPGDWVHIDYQGGTVVGMIARIHEGSYTFAYWDGGVLRFGAAKPRQIGDWDERMTAYFRAAIAVDPHYLAKYIALWKEPDEAELRQVRQTSAL